MKTRSLIFCTLSAIALIFSSCSQNPTSPINTTPQPSSIRGVVIRSDDRTAVPGAFVQDTRGPVDTSKADGSFKLNYSALTSNYSSTIIASRNTFGGDTIAFTLAPGHNDSLSRPLILKADSTSQKTASGTGVAASIVLVGGGDVSNISVRGTGFTESNLLTFEVRDSLGIPVLIKTHVFFSILADTSSGGLGGAYVFPASGMTDLSGRVSTRVNSGTKAGVLQIYAYAKPDTSNPNFIIKSTPVRMTISGGLPDLAHFSISAQKYNMAGLLFDNLRDNISVIVGDKDGNPVQPGTAIYFKTTGGLIQPSATTDKDGIATVSVISANPRPGNGQVLITATTIGDSGKIVTKTVGIVFSGRTVITPPAGNFTIADSGSYSFGYTVADVNGNPIVGKSGIKVSVSGPGSGDLVLSGDVDITVPDAALPGNGRTQFQATLTDKTRGGATGIVVVTIAVTTDEAAGNGNASTSFSAYQQSAGGGGGFGGGTSGIGQVSNLTLTGISPSTGNLSVRGTGSGETARLTFIARDSLGRPVADPLNPSTKVYVMFSLSPSLGGGEFLFPTADSTDLTGQVSTTFNSGTKAGVLQITATAISGARTITAAPVVIGISGGLPDSNHMTVTLSKVNMPGIPPQKSGTLGTVNVQVGDEFGNPAQPSKVSFNISGGQISPIQTTDLNGQASANIFGGYPIPTDFGTGRGIVTVQTVGQGGVSIKKQLPFLFSGSPVVFGPASGFQIPDSGFYTFTFKVSDGNGNPLVSGTTIVVTRDGAGSGDLDMKGDVNVTMPDTKDTARTNFKVQVQDKSSGGASGEVDFRISVNGDNGTAQYSWSGTQLAKGQSIVGVSNGYASSIEVLAKSQSTISVKGTGNTETSTIVWVVKDSLGNPIALSRQVPVKFTFLARPNGGEFLFPDSSLTDAAGHVASTVNSGTKAGVVQVVASIVGTTIKSSPAALVISGGLPDSNHVTASLSKVNMPGLVKAGTLGQVSVQLADIYGNPVPSGTAVYFTTNGGAVDASGITGGNGSVSVNLSGGNPAPSSPTPGLGFVTMETGGTSGKISRQIPFLFSGAPKISGPASGFQIADSGQYNFTFKVADLNGNPLSSGVTITVTKDGPGSGDLDLKGDANKIMPDTKDTSLTNFSVQVQDKTHGGASGAVTFTISVAGDNGTATYSWSGTQLAQGVSVGGSSAGYASSIQILAVNPAAPGPISVKGTGSGETATMSFQVRDSLGNPLDPSRTTNVTFTIQNGPGGGEFVFPASLNTNAGGQVSTTLNAGTKAGVVQLIAQTTVGAVTIKSSPVQMTIASGLADPNHFTMWTSSQVTNLPIAAAQMYQTPVATIDVLIADKYGNPAQSTAVYFTSNGGVIGPSAITHSEGSASVVLMGGNPQPPGGIDTVTASTAGDNGQSIIRRLIFTGSGNSIVTVPGYPSGNLPALTDGGFLLFTFDVKDANNNPIAAGNTISVSATGDVGVTGQLGFSINGSGTSVTTVDTRDTTKVHYQLKIADNSPGAGAGGAFTVFIISNGPNGTNVTKQLTGFLQAPGVVVGGGGGTGYTSSITLSSTSATDISVQGTGSTETATLVFQAKDSLGQVVDQAHGSMMHFTISAPTLGATLTIDSIQTDASGRATTLVRSGSIAGVIQVRASVTVNGKTYSSDPVRLSINSGLPDQNHFSIAAKQYNFPGLRFNGLQDNITIQMGDAFGNPVQTGTVAYFTTNHGVIQTTGSTTNSDGFISKTLFSGNPRPEGGFIIAAGVGFSYVTVSTDGPAGSIVHDSVKILWTGPPIITRLSGVPAFSIPKGGNAGPWTFTVVDIYGHPMSEGTSITAAADGGIVSGNTGTLTDTQVGGSGITSFSIMLANADKVGGTNPSLASQLIVTVSHPVYGTFFLILDSGTMQ